MAQISGTFSTYDATGNREDLSDYIWAVDLTETPFTGNIERVPSMATKHEWQTDSPAAAAANAHIEGDEASFTADGGTTRLDNQTQILKKTVLVTRTQEKVKKAGRKSEVRYQEVKRGIELRKDLEKAALDANAKVVGNDTTAREMAGVPTWLNTNTDGGSGFAAATGDGSDAPTDGTPRALTETILKDVHQSTYESGGNPNVLMLGTFNKRKASEDFAGIGTREKDVSDLKIVATADVYVGDFGEFFIVPNIFQRARDGFLLQLDMWALAELDPIFSEDLAKTGDTAAKKQIVTEVTLEARNEKASGFLADLTTS